MDLSSEREAVVAACRALAAEGLVPGSAGNVSARRGDRIVVTPTGAALGELRAGDLSAVDLSGAVIAGPAPTSELELHLAVLRGRPEACAVVHTHAPVSTALSCVLDELPTIHYSMVTLGGAVRVAPYATFGTPELAERCLAALGGRSAALLANHGTVTCGTDVAAALDATRLLEWAAEVYWRAAQVGTPRILGTVELADAARAFAAYGQPR